MGPRDLSQAGEERGRGQNSGYLWISEDGDAHGELPLLASAQVLGLGGHDLLQVQILQHLFDLFKEAG